MSTESPKAETNPENAFSREVGRQAARKIRAAQAGDSGAWFGLGVSGIVGWSVAVPTVLGAASGRWVDGRYPSPYSWTLMLLLGGLLLGCLNAWHWVLAQKAHAPEEHL